MGHTARLTYQERADVTIRNTLASSLERNGVFLALPGHLRLSEGLLAPQEG